MSSHVTAYAALVRESKAIGWPKIYRTDLTVHDRAYLRKDKPQAFVWVLREHGTHLYDDVKDRWALQYHVLNERALYYTYDADGLHPATPKQVLGFLARLKGGVLTGLPDFVPV